MPCCTKRVESVHRWIFRPLAVFLIVFAFLFRPAPAEAAGIYGLGAEGSRLSSGALAIDCDFRVELPKSLSDALLDGVGLDFELSYQITAPKILAYKTRLQRLFDSSDGIVYRLSYHPLTGNYRVRVGSFFTEHSTLDAALRVVGKLVSYPFVPAERIASVKDEDLEVGVRLALSFKSLPKPFQINAFASNDWRLDSGWRPVAIRGVENPTR